VGSAWAKRLVELRVTPWASVLFSVVSIAAVPFADIAAGDTLADIVLELTLGLIATLALWAVVWPGILITRLAMRPGWARQITVVALITVGGALRGVVIFSWGEMLSFESDASLGLRLMNSVTTTVVWLVLLSLFTHAGASFKRRYGTLFRQVALARASQASNSEVSKILGGLEASLRGLDVAPVDEALAHGEMARIATTLERDTVARIREHSKNLWSFGSKDAPRLRFLPLLRLAVEKLDYSVGFVWIIFVVLGIPNVASVVGLGEATWRVLVAALVILAWHLFYWRLVVPRIAVGFSAHLVYLLCLGALVQIPMGLPWYLAENSSAAPLFSLLLVIPVAALPVLDSTLRLAELARDEVLEALQGPSGEDQGDEPNPEFRPERSVSRASLAAYLHNSLQSEIQSIILALKSAASDPTKVHIGQASLQRLRVLTSRSLDEEFSSFTTVPREHLDQVIAGWRGILDISLRWRVEARHDNDPRVATVVHIIEEVASNSAVHGRATNLVASVSRDGNDFLVTIDTNSPDSLPLGPGQGSQWLGAYLDPIAPVVSALGGFCGTYRIH
jgi:hypothetical protein